METEEAGAAARQISIKQLAELDWTRSRIDSFLRRPPPKDYRLTKQTHVAVRALDNLFNLWKQVLVPTETGHEAAQSVLSEIVEGNSDDLPKVRMMFLTVMIAHFDCLLRPFLVAESSPDLEVPQALVSKNYMGTMATKEMYEQEDEFKPLRHISILYLGALSIAHMYSFIRAMPIAHRLGRFEGLVHESLKDFIETATRYPTEPFRPFVSHLQRSAVRMISQIYADDGSEPNDLSIGPFSAIRLHELAALSRRSPAVLKRYGTKTVEKRFEQQLALIVQSFGFIVVSTQVGQGTVDLLCISTDPAEPFTFLIEAKSTSKSYSLPSKDSRALRDYVTDVRRTLTALPPLSFVLVVSHTPAKTLNSKITILEAQVAVPVRFMGAQQLAELRESLVGPFPLRMFREAIVTSDRILPNDLVKSIEAKATLERKAYQEFAEGLFQAKGVIRIH